MELVSLIIIYRVMGMSEYNMATRKEGFAGGSVVKNTPANAGDMGSIPKSRRYPGGGHGNPLQYSCLENPTDRGALRAIAHTVAKESDAT